MSPIPEKIDFSQLSIPERILLVEQLWDSIAKDASGEPLPLTEAQRKELESRCTALDSGATKTIPWDEAKRSLFSGE